jgi:phage/plasmid-like protein (TIGR03299 family)
MTDHVETMAWVAEKPWHGLGVEVASNLSASEMMGAAGLDWEVQKRPLYYKVGKDSRRVIKDRFGLVRNTDEQFLSLCGPRYQPVQNRDVFDFFHKFVDAGHMQMHTAGSLLDGRFIWALAKVGDHFSLGRKDEDRTEGYLLLMSPHEAGRSLIIQHTSVRVVCWNTLNMALGAGLKGRKGAFKFGHVRPFDENVKQQAEEALGLSHEHLAELTQQAALLAEKRVSPEWTEEYLKAVFKLDDASLLQREATDSEMIERKRTSPVLVKARAALENAPGQKLSTADGTAWGALNAVTYTVDHLLGNSREKTMRDVWLGYRGETKRRALDLALSLPA